MDYSRGFTPKDHLTMHREERAETSRRRFELKLFTIAVAIAVLSVAASLA